MARRLPSRPPNLPGFSYIRVLGSGGFADVFLYEQNLPRRQVAVKVMLAEVVTSRLRDMFQAEADVMAQLGSHPSILTVFQAGVSSDGRPYIVMELCSAAFNHRYRERPVAVTEALAVGIKIGSAVETAHRAGVLHRDIKPSNILMTAYGHPVLSDFGIAATLGELPSEESVGFSVPWSAPEVILDGTSGTVASEVFSLGATIFSLLAGRSPFELPDGDNSSSELAGRITRGKPTPIARADVPASLDRLLARTLSRRPELRQATAWELVRELQAVEAELGVPQTPAEVAMDDWAMDDWAGTAASDPGDRTKVRKAVAPTGHARSSEDTGVDGSGHHSAARRTRWFAWGLAACSVLVVAFGATAALLAFRSTSDDIPSVRNISSQLVGGSVLFSWPDPGLRPSDAYQVSIDSGPASIQHANEFRVDADVGTRVCITVSVNRDGTSGPAGNQKCVTR